MADHKGVLTQVAFKILKTATHQREVWHFGDADWDRIASNIEETSLEFLSETFPSEEATRFTEELLRIAEENIPKRSASIRKTTHPWRTERDEEAVRRKHAAQGTEQEAVAARECSEILLEEHYDFVRKCCRNCGGKAFVQKMLVKLKTVHGQKAASIEHPSFETRGGMDPRAGRKSELLRELFRSKTHNVRCRSE